MSGKAPLKHPLVGGAGATVWAHAVGWDHLLQFISAEAPPLRSQYLRPGLPGSKAGLLDWVPQEVRNAGATPVAH